MDYIIDYIDCSFACWYFVFFSRKYFHNCGSDDLACGSSHVVCRPGPTVIQLEKILKDSDIQISISNNVSTFMLSVHNNGAVN